MVVRPHVLPPPELELPRTLHDDRHRLEETDVPILTVSASFRSEIAKNFGEKVEITEEIVFSRAHYSMAIAILSAANQKGLTACLVDPTNYVSTKDWEKLVLMERIGKLAARTPLLKAIKNIFDSVARSKSPLASAIQKPLKYVTARTIKPIISVHYEVGNMLAKLGKKVIQIVTDPHVRSTYLSEAHLPNIVFAVFDQTTKEEFLYKARKLGKKLHQNQVVVTGPPIDRRIINKRKNKNPISYKKRGLRLAITTGGLGTNKDEIEDILKNLLPNLGNTKLILYASTHKDFRSMFYDLPAKYGVEVTDVDSSAPVRVIYDESIIRANQELVEYVFGWADGFVTKPSGDMAYDAVAAGCFLLLLEPWGQWEKNIETIFTNLKVAQKAESKNFTEQVSKLKSSGWIENAIKKALNTDQLLVKGANKIVDLQQRLSVQ